MIDLDSAEGLGSSTSWQPLLIAIVIGHHSGPSLANTRLTGTQSTRHRGSFTTSIKHLHGCLCLDTRELEGHSCHNTTFCCQQLITGERTVLTGVDVLQRDAVSLTLDHNAERDEIALRPMSHDNHIPGKKQSKKNKNKDDWEKSVLH